MSDRRLSPDEGAEPAGGDFNADDAALLAAVRRKDKQASTRFVQAHYGRMLATATRLLNDPSLAQDCVQEAFLSALRNLDRFEGRSGVGTWLHRITVNTCLMALRKQRRKAEDPLDELMPVFDENGCRIEPAWPELRPVDELVADREVRTLVTAEIDTLPDTYRNVLILRDIEEMSTREVADVLQISESAVRIRLHRARAALKKKLEPVLARGDR